MRFTSLPQLLTPALFALFVMAPLAATADDTEEAALEEAHQKFAEVLQNTNNLFFKQQTNDNGVKFYSVIWELNGTTTKMLFSLKVLGTYHGQTVIGMTGWTAVMESENPVPPAVIKAIATMNDRLTVGNLSCSEDFRTVYANITASTDGLTSGTMWMYCAYLQENAGSMKVVCDEATSGSLR